MQWAFYFCTCLSNVCLSTSAVICFVDIALWYARSGYYLQLRWQVNKAIHLVHLWNAQRTRVMVQGSNRERSEQCDPGLCFIVHVNQGRPLSTAVLLPLGVFCPFPLQNRWWQVSMKLESLIETMTKRSPHLCFDKKLRDGPGDMYTLSISKWALLVAGDVNAGKLKSVLQNAYQHVTCVTREEKKS